MRFVVMTAAACSLFASVAFAQAPAAPAAPAAAAENSTDAGPGTTAFNQSQAISHIEARGFTRVRKMAKDENGLWQGTAFKGGSMGTVSLEKMGKVNWVKL